MEREEGFRSGKGDSMQHPLVFKTIREAIDFGRETNYVGDLYVGNIESLEYDSVMVIFERSWSCTSYLRRIRHRKKRRLPKWKRA
jgi:hypothetical protein